MWRAQLDAVGASNEAIAYDRRGFGETRAEKEDFSAVADLLAVLDSVGNGAPEPIHPLDIEGLMARLKDAEQAGDLDRVNAIKAHLWLDGPLQPEGRVTGEARRLFPDMNGIALRSTPVGSNLDVAPAFHRLGEISAPSLVIWGDFDFPHIQERCRHVAMTMPNGSGHMLTGMAHLPSLERPTEITGLLAAFIDGCSDRRA
jgi:pimeloyl-ACP methyl ester carboxylesterase